MAIEDAAPLLSTPPPTKELVEQRLALFQKVRHPRNTIVKLLSGIAPGIKPLPMDLFRKYP
jgi:hypothetical protein